jgi:phosphoglycolate phosphatase-like HAD superfamily hydrolase
MGVLVFDIDGTLTETSRVDGAFFMSAVREVWPDVELDSFRRFTEFTDTAILRAICDEQGGMDYDSAQGRVHRHFLDGLGGALSTEPASFDPVPGARTIFAEVRRAGWIPAIATGGWRAPAVLKLRAARIPTSGVPLATSTERARRVDIIRLAISQALSVERGGDTVYVGDGTWDVRACRELGIGFVGRAPTADSTTGLEQEGARAVIRDFSDPSLLLDLLADPAALRPAAAPF